MSVVGTAYIVVRAISSSLEKDFSKAAEKAAKSIGPALSKMDEPIEKATRQAVTKAGQAAAPDAGKAGHLLGKSMADAVPGAFLNKMGAHVRSGVRKAVVKAGADKEGNNLGARLFSGFGKSISKFRVPPIAMLGFLGIPAIGGAITILTAYVASAVSLISTLGPALGAVGSVGIAGLLTLGGAVAAVMLALKTDSPMLDRFKAATAGVKEEFKAVGLAVQKELLPKLAQAMGQTTSLIPTLTTGLSAMGGAVGNVAVHLAEVVTSARFMENLGTMFANGAPAVEHFGGATGHLLDILVTLAAVASPLLTDFAMWAESMLGGAAASAAAAQESGRLAEWMTKAAGMASQWGAIIGDFGTGLFNVFKAASGSGQTLLDSISQLAARFAVWSGSMEGQNTLKAFFDNAVPVVREVNGLIGDVLSLIGKPLVSGDTGGIISFVQSMRNYLLPALVQIGDAASGMGPGLAELAKSLAGLIESMANSGALGAFVGTLNILIQGLTALFQLPVVGQLAGWALAFGGAAKAVDLVMKPVGGLTTLTGPLGRALFGVAADANGLGGKVGLLPKALGAAGNAAKAFGNAAKASAVGQWVLNSALLANPITWIVIAIIAFVAALVLAYNKSETFRNIVDAVGAAIKTGLGAALEWLKGLWDKVWPALVQGWELIKQGWEKAKAGAAALWDGLKAAWEGIKSGWDTLVGWFEAGVGIITGVWDSIVGAITGAWDFINGIFSSGGGIINIITQPFQGLIQFFTGAWELISGIFTGNWDKITSGIANMVGGIVRFFMGMPSRIMGVLVEFGPTIWNWITSVASTAWSYVVVGWDLIVAYFTSLPGRIIDGVTSLISSIVTWATDVWNTAQMYFTVGLEALIIYVQSLPQRVIDAVTSLLVSIGAWATGVWNSAQAYFTAGVDAVVSFVTGLPGRVISAVNSLISSIQSWASGVWAQASSAFSTGVDNVVSFVRGLPGRVVSAIGNVGSMLSNAGRDLIQGFINGVNGMIGSLTSAARSIAGKAVDAIKGALGINSPSKVFMEIGGSVGEGFVMGIDRMQKAAAQSAGALAGVTVSATSGGLGPSGQGLTARGGGAAGMVAGGTTVYGGISVNLSIDDLDRINRIEDFFNMLSSARVQQRKTLRSGTVTA